MPSEIAVAMRFDTLRYSRVWEDYRLPVEGLRIGPNDDVLSVASAGDNVLALLLSRPRSVLAIDINPAQAALLQIKLAGIRRLSHEEFARLLGAREGADRLALYERLRGELPEAARDFWDGHAGDIASGILNAGRLERYFEAFQRDHLAPLLGPGAIERLLHMDDVREQETYFDRVIATPEVERAFTWYFGREVMSSRGRDPAQFRYVEEDEVGAYFWERFRFACTRIPIRGNFYLESFLSSRYRDLERGPLYLRRSGFARLRGLLDRVRVVTGALEDVLEEAEPGTLSKANLSNLFEYLSADATAEILERLAETLRPDGRICYWNLLVERSAPDRLHDRLRPLRADADALWRTDRSWFYRAFYIDELLPR